MQHRTKVSLAKHHPESMATIFKLKTDDWQTNCKLMENLIAAWIFSRAFDKTSFKWNPNLELLSNCSLNCPTTESVGCSSSGWWYDYYWYSVVRTALSKPQNNIKPWTNTGTSNYPNEELPKLLKKYFKTDNWKLNQRTEKSQRQTRHIWYWSSIVPLENLSVLCYMCKNTDSDSPQKPIWWDRINCPLE